MRLLLVEDDPALGEGIRTALKPEGYTVDWLQDGASALHALTHESFDLAVLDLGLPRLDGLEVLRRLRAEANPVPVLVLTRAMPPPTASPGSMPGPTTTWSNPSTSPNSRRACVRCCGAASTGQSRCWPTATSCSIRSTSRSATRQPGQPAAQGIRPAPRTAGPARPVLTRDKLQQVLYGWDEDVESNALEVHIHHLRKKFFPELIRTVRGVGYLVDK